MAVKHKYLSDRSPKEAEKDWQELNRKRYNSPQKIEAREGRDRELKRTNYYGTARPEEGNQYAHQAFKDENGEGINRIRETKQKNGKERLQKYTNELNRIIQRKKKW